RFALGADSAAMGRCIYAAREAAEDHHAATRKITGEPFGHADSIRRGMTRADHGNAWLRKHRNVAANIEHEWRVIDLTDASGIRRVLERDAFDAGGSRFRDFIMRELDGTSGAEGLRGRRR